MKLTRIFFLLCILFTAQHSSATPSFVKIRPQYTNTPYELFFKETCLPWESTMYIAGKYTESFDASTISSYLFGADALHPPYCASFIKIEGSQFNNGNRDEKAWLADYFGLPTDFASSICFNPSIKQLIIPLHVAWAGAANFYGTFELTAVDAHWQLCTQEKIINPGIREYIAGYFSSEPVERDELVDTALNFLNGTQTPDLGDGIIFQPLACSRIGTNAGSKKSGIAGIEGLLGWFFIADDHANCGIHLRAVAPIQRPPSCKNLFTPIIGNGGHWAAGIGIDAAICMLEKQNSSLGLSLTAYVQHLFQTHQTRSFDLRGKPNSRYMLAQKLGPQRDTPRLVGPSDAGIEFQNEFAPVANITTSRVSVSIPVEAEFTALLSYDSRHLHLGIGYNLWAQSAERICLTDRCLPALSNKQWALKGDAQVIGFEDPGNAPVRLAATQDATIHSGTNNFPDGVGGIPYFQNPGVLNPQAASTDGTNPNVIATPGDTDTTPLFTSNRAVVLNQCSLDLSGTRALSQKLFATIAFTGHEYGTAHIWAPFISIGGEIEWGSQDKVGCCENTGKFNCPKTVSPHNFALNQWGVWLALGITL